MPTTHKPCLYSGIVNGERVLFKRQADDFELAVPSERTANIIFDMIDDRLTFPLKRMGLVNLFNGIDVLQREITLRYPPERTSSASLRNIWRIG